MDTHGCGLGYWTRGQEFWRKSVICLIGVVVWLISLAVVTPQTADAFNPMIHSSESTGSSKWPIAESGDAVDGWGIAGGQYGEFTCGTCHGKNTGNVKRVKATISYPDSSTMPGGGTSAVVSLQTVEDGTSDLGDDSTAPRGSSNKVCEVCHTYDAAQLAGTKVHAANQSVTTEHYDNADCIKCHEHKFGFKASCDSCHASPPINNATDLVKDGSTPGDETGSVTVGKHDIHANTLSYACNTCHTGWETTGEMPKGGEINIGFDIFGSNAGDYDGRSTGSYNANAPTTVTLGNNLDCTIYCHGSTIGGISASAIWNDADTLACGDCHKGTAAQMQSGALGSHGRHAGDAAGQLSLTCDQCHGTTPSMGDAHLDGQVAWDVTALSGTPPTYAGAASGSDGPAPTTYESCANAYCHSNVQSSNGTAAADTYATPTWGDTVSCGDCHGDGTGRPATGSHTAHNAYGCTICHSGAGDETVNHANEEIDVIFDGSVDSGSAAYSQSPNTPGNGYGSCSSITCHGSGTPTWGDAGSVACNDCHGFGGIDPGHVTDSRVITAGTNCEHCHEAGHPQGTTATTILIPNNATVGIDYSSGGIHLLKTIKSIANTTEAETCWDCHDAQGTPVSEWDSNNNVNTGGLGYNYGSLGSSAAWYSDVTPGSEVGSSWSSGKGADFSYKTGNIQSTHSANSAGTAAVTSGNGLGFNRSETLDTVDSIRCSFCHDVHSRNLAPGDALTGVPYLRGSWKGNPYPEDGAPRTGWSNWSREGTTSDYGLVPRGSASRANTGKTGVPNLGGYWIDQNTDDPNNGLTATETAGLCDLCHGSTKNGTWTNAELAAIDETTGEGLWISGYNGHANVVLKGQASDTDGPGRGINGSAESYARNIFTRARRGSAVRDPARTAYNDRVDMGLSTYSSGSWGTSYRGNNSRNTASFQYSPRIGSSTTGGTGTEQPYAYGYFAWNNAYNTKGSATHWLSTGTMDLNVGNITTTTSTSDTETADYDAQANYHTFNCGKCHNPHASRLPKLMITNCLDTNHNSWDNDYQAATSTSVDTVWRDSRLSQWPSAQNCHRLDERASFSSGQSEARGTGWNKATPWLETTSP